MLIGLGAALIRARTLFIASALTPRIAVICEIGDATSSVFGDTHKAMVLCQHTEIHETEQGSTSAVSGRCNTRVPLAMSQTMLAATESCSVGSSAHQVP